MDETPKKRGPKVNSAGQRQLDQAQESFNKFDESIKDLTLDRMNQASKEDKEPQTQLSQNEIAKSKEIHLKPIKTIFPPPDRKTGEQEKFNEKFREAWNVDKEEVQFIAENREIIGEAIQLWTKPFPGIPAELWEVPCNKPVWGPRYLKDQIKRKYYHRLVMQEHIDRGRDQMGTYYGAMVADTTIQRLDALPVDERKTISFHRKAAGF
jgi:hypothetical protein